MFNENSNNDQCVGKQFDGCKIQDYSQIQYIINQLKRGKTIIEANKAKKVILVLGNAGSRKTDLIRFLTATNEKLKKDLENSSSYDQRAESDFPKLILDSQNVAFYDLPGFNNTRKESSDVLIDYYMKSILDCADEIKVIFTIEYVDLNPTIDNKENFTSLIAHTAKLMENIEKIEDSIALVVTKVSDNDNYNVYENEGKIKNNIATFLKNIRKENMNTALDKNVARFVDIILRMQDQNYTKIGIFDDLDFAKNYDSSETNKISLKTLIHDNTSYAKSKIHYSLSRTSIDYIHGLRESMLHELTESMNNIAKKIKKNYQLKEKSLTDIEEVKNTFMFGWEKLSILFREIFRVSNPQNIGEKILQATIDLGIINLNTDIYFIADDLVFMQSILNHPKSKLELYKWTNGLNNLLKYFDDSQKWYTFLIKLYKILSSYDIQKQINSNPTYSAKFVDYVENCCKQNNSNEILYDDVLSQDFTTFFKTIKNEDLNEEYENIQFVELNASRLKFLKKILRFTLLHEVKSSCSKKNEFTIKGHYINLQDIKKRMKEKKCFKPKVISILASDKIFIDTNLDMTGQEAVIFIASPTWEVVGKSNITLNGSSGIPLPYFLFSNYDVVRRPAYSGDPGGPGGNFIGIGKTFINGQNLMISLNGGRGGNGLRGGDYQNRGDIKELFPPNANNIFSYEGVYYTYSPVGTEGEVGGEGGTGGYPGNAELINFNKKSYHGIVIERSRGQIGECGGLEGKTPLDDINIIKVNIVFTPYNDAQYEIFNTKYQAGKKPNCTNALSGPISKKAKRLNLFSSTRKYGNYLRKQIINKNIKEKSLREILFQLDEYENEKGLLNEYVFNNKIQDLEELYYKSQNNVAVLPFYQTLLQSIKSYISNQKYNKVMTDRSIALNYLYAATLSKVNQIQLYHTDLIIDIRGYLKLAQDQIKEIKTLKSTQTMKDYNKDYKDSINQKINEANHFIHKQLMVEIDNILKNIDAQIIRLVNDTKDLQKKTKEDKEQLKTELIKQQEEMKKAFILKTIFNVTRAACLLLNFLGPVGSLVGGVIGTTTMVAESLLVKKESTVKTTLSKLPKAIDNSLSEVSKQLEKKKKNFDKQLSDMKKELETLPEDERLLDVERDITGIQKTFNNRSSTNDLDTDFFNKKKDASNKVKTVLNNKTEKLKNDKSEKNKLKSERAGKQLKVIKKVKNIANVAQIGFDLYQQIKSDYDELDVASDAIEQADIQLRKLEEYEKSIYSTIVPVCNDLRNSVNEVTNSLKNKSHVALDVSKWQVQNHLREVKDQLQKLTSETNVEKNLTDFVDKLMEGISVMIKIYDRIQDYQDKKELADYIYNINRVDAVNDIHNSTLKSVLDQSKLMLQSNVLLDVYTRFMNAFVQYVYPFADQFLNGEELPLNKQPTNIASLEVDISQVLKSLGRKLENSDATLGPYFKAQTLDDIQFDENSEFNDFYEWDYATNKDAVSKLLQGKEVILKSDVKVSVVNAIKFKKLNIHFKLKNSTLQNKFDRDLYPFSVTMTHLGDSHYRCGNYIHIITTNNVTFHCSINGTYANLNSVHYQSKMPTLSPYATWSIRLSSDVGKSLKPLEKYENESMNITLRGTANIVQLTTTVCTDDLNKYYETNQTQIKTKNYFLSEEYSFKNKRFGSPRKRRSLHSDKFNTHPVKNAFITSGASSNSKYSLINNIANFIGGGLLAIQCYNPISKINQWFNKYENIHYFEDSILSKNNAYIPLKSKDNQLTESELQNFINDESHSMDSTLFNDSLLSNHNLLLLDLIVRLKSGVKYEQEKVLLNEKHEDSAYAHGLAYRDYVPKSKNRV